jgi:hypothetical protein
MITAVQGPNAFLKRKRAFHELPETPQVLDCPAPGDDTAFGKSDDLGKALPLWKINAIRKRCHALLATAVQDASAN